MGVHLENALRSAILPGRWPKSTIDVAVMVLEGEDNNNGLQDDSGVIQIGYMNILAGCITVATAALVDARIDCVDLLAGGVAATVVNGSSTAIRVLDPCPGEHDRVLSACVVGYMPSRDEVADVWVQGAMESDTKDGDAGFDLLLDSAIAAARGSQTVLKEVLIEPAKRQAPSISRRGDDQSTQSAVDVQMKL